MKISCVWLYARFYLFLPLCFTSCEDFGDPPPRIDLNPRNPSIEGIHLGDSPERVQKVLGPPPGTGWLDGLGASWRSYQYYYEDRHTFGLLVAFINDPGVEEWGPVDFISVENGYSGKTHEGIGIGSTRATVYRHFGLPQRSAPMDSIGGSRDDYCRGKTLVEFLFLRDTVRIITLGPLKPSKYDLSCE